MRSFVALLSEDPGFQAKGVLAMEVPMPSSRYDWNKAARFLNTQLLPAVESPARRRGRRGGQLRADEPGAYRALPLCHALRH